MKTNNRIAYLDHLKWMGILLVYYGHFVPHIPKTGIGPIFWQSKMIYSFHMPLFFFLSGIFWSREKAQTRNYLRNRFVTLFIPVIFWTIVYLPLWWTSVPHDEVMRLLALYPMGRTGLFPPGWFLLCLLMVELVLFGFSKVIKRWDQPSRKIVYIMISFVIGFLFYRFQNEFQSFTGIDPSIWYVREVFTAIGFFLTGSLLKSYITERTRGGLFDWLILCLSLISFIMFRDMNQGNGIDNFIIVDMANSIYGNYFWFLVNAFSGIFFSLAIFRIIKIKSRAFQFIGENTIIFFGLNGFNFTVLDHIFIGSGILPENQYLAALMSIGYLVLCLLVYIPFARLMKNKAPLLVGARSNF